MTSLAECDLLDPRTLWDDYQPTRVINLPELARRAGVRRVLVKLEAERPLGNFKVLGGMAAGLRALARAAVASPGTPPPRLICASDGNHGLAVAAAARRAGVGAAIYLPHGVSPLRARRITALGGEVIWTAGTYDDAVARAAAAASHGEGLLISDTTGDLGDAVVQDVMAGYALIAREIIAQLRDHAADDRPSHAFVQAGVGGLAAAMADGLRDILQEPLAVVEPASAACVARGLAAGHPVQIAGDLHSSAEMLACGLASAPALAILQRRGARAVAVVEAGLHAAVAALREAGGPDTTPSGAAGLAGLLHVAADSALRAAHRLTVESCVLLIATEAALEAG